MARLDQDGNAPDGGAKRRRPDGAFSFFLERAWVKYWIISDQYALCLAVEGKGLMRSASVTLLDAGGGRTGERTWRRIAGGGWRLFPDASRISVRHRGCAVTFQREGSARRVFGCAERWAEDQPLLFDLRLTGRLDSDTGIFAAFPEQGRWFGRRVAGALRAEGRAAIGGEEYLFAPAHSLGLLEEGAGIPRGCSAETQALMSGWIDGTPAAILLDGAARESVLMLAGRAWKLGPIAWDDPGAVSAHQAAPSASAFPVPRRLASLDGRVTLAFDPLAEQRGPCRRFFRRKGEEIRVFGRFSGTIRLENGRTVPVRQMSGIVRRLIPGRP